MSRARLVTAWIWVWLFSAILFISGCYSFSARTSTHIRSVGIPFFENKTTRFGIESKLTSEIARGFMEDGALRVVDEGVADSVIRGEITGYEVKAAVFDQNEVVSKMRVIITVNVIYRDLVQNTVVWEQKGLSKWREYRLVVGGDEPAQTEEDGQDEAIRKIVQELLARSIETW